MSEEEEVKVDVETPSAKEDKADDLKKADENKPADANEPNHIKIQTKLTSEQKSYFGIFMAAIVQIIAVGVLDQNVYGALRGYGIALGSVSIVFSVIGLAMGAMKSLEARVKVLNSYFLFLWTFIGACFMTFGSDSPFKSTGNGYFASWGMVLFSVMAVGVSFDEARHAATGMGPRLGLFLSALIVLIASASYLSDGKIQANQDETSWNVGIFAVTLSSITVITIFLLIFCGVRRNDDANPNPVVFFVVLVFCICWIVEAFYSTFHGPFQFTGNGYFASWGAAFSALFATVAGARRMMEPRKEPEREQEEENEE